MTASETPAELKFVSMDDTTAPIDYGLEYLETGLASGQQGAGDRWQAAFEAARDGWDLVHAQQLLLLVKRLSLDLRRQSVVRYLEGTLMVRQGEWPAAVVAFERALANKRQVGDGAGEVAVLNALASLYRRMDKPLDEVAQLYEQALGLTKNSSDDATRAGLQTGLGVTYYAQGKLDRARACQEEVLTLARNLGDRALEATALHILAPSPGRAASSSRRWRSWKRRWR